MDFSQNKMSTIDDDMENKDRISGLPKNLIESILEKVSSHDGARTSILSRKWRYIWSSLPKLVLDEEFFSGLKPNMLLYNYFTQEPIVTEENVDQFCRIIDKILMLHNGPIQEFILYIPFHQNPDLDHWILLLSRNGIKKLTLYMAVSTPYNLPSYIFSCDRLTYLSMFNCVVNPPLDFSGFYNLNQLYLEKNSFSSNTGSVIYNLPALEKLSFRSCTGVENVKLLAPKLNWFEVVDSHEFKWDFFQSETNLEKLYLVVLEKEVLDVDEHVEDGFNLVMFLANLPKLRILWLNGFSVKFLASGSLSECLSIYALVEINLETLQYNDLDQVSCALCLLRNSPNLKDLHIEASTITRDQTKQHILDYMEATAKLGMVLKCLKTVKLGNFSGLNAELLLVKLLLLHSSSLERIVINRTIMMAASKEKEISRKLMRFHRASALVQIVYE